MNSILICENVAKNGFTEYRVAICDPASLYIREGEKSISHISYLGTFGHSVVHKNLGDALKEASSLVKQHPELPIESIKIPSSFDAFLYRYWIYFAEHVLPIMQERAKDEPALLADTLVRTINEYASIQQVRLLNSGKNPN